MKKFLFFLVAPAALLVSFTSMPDHVSFTGDWKLNEGKSELGDFGARFAATAIKIDQKADAITIARTRPGRNGGDPTTTSVTLTFDGKETETTGFGNSKTKSTAKWSDDGQTFTINSTTSFERDGQTSEFKGTETWTLKDGALSIVSVNSSPRGETTIKAVYDK
ncbi:MAG: hypothetical protein E6H09_05495 [Bacteroidetes bacterium]|jgi:hypothetical protein|nr:MAG: hypothetical protein E6H09_05495 [Bacteroidota bacterium]